MIQSALILAVWLLAGRASAWQANATKEAQLKAKHKNRLQCQVRNFQRLPRKAQPLKWLKVSLETCAALAGFSCADTYIDALEGPVCPMPLFDEEGSQELCFTPALGIMAEARNTALGETHFSGGIQLMRGGGKSEAGEEQEQSLSGPPTDTEEQEAEIQARIQQLEEELAALRQPKRQKTAGVQRTGPETPLEELRGVAGGRKSNRRYPGEQPKRQDLEAWEAMKMINFMKEQRPNFEDETTYWRAMIQKYKPRSKKSLQTIISKEEVFNKRMEELRLGDGRARRPKGSGEQLSLKSASKGCRAGGASREDIFKELRSFAWSSKTHL